MQFIKEALNEFGRPFLTVFITGVFNAVCGWGVLSGRMTFHEYLEAIGPANGMIVGFWFGEKAALKDPKGDGLS